MPCNYKEYHPKWSLISKLIRHYRAKNRCEWCKVQDLAVIVRNQGSRYTYLNQEQYDQLSKDELRRIYCTRVVLTVAHLDHNKGNNRFHNLAALCQRCHLNHDIRHHLANRNYGRDRHKNQLSIFEFATI